MRFVSQYTNYVINIRNPRQAVHRLRGRGESASRSSPSSTRTHWNAARHGGRRSQSFQFQGMFQFEDEATPVPPAYRLSVYDTDEQARRAGLGRGDEGATWSRRCSPRKGLGRDFVLVQEIALAPPWPSYDDFAGERRRARDAGARPRLRPRGGHRLRAVEVGAAARGRARRAPGAWSRPATRGRSSSHDRRALGKAGDPARGRGRREDAHLRGVASTTSRPTSSSEDDVERVRLGYVCIICLEPHEQHHPAHCQVCPFPMRAIQDEVFEEMYEGEVQVGPSTTLAEEMEIAQEIVERGGGR